MGTLADKFLNTEESFESRKGLVVKLNIYSFVYVFSVVTISKFPDCNFFE